MAPKFSQTFGIEELPQIATALLEQRTSHIILLNGPLGAGKTTLVKALIQALGAADTGTSPTFGLLNEYASISGEVIAYHLDAYRLNNEEEAYDLGLEEFWAQNTLFIIEWPDKLGSVLPSDAFFVNLDYTDDGKRQIRW